jgi:flavin reductase (DIM6/NTAB) family NADH-FMN oxidoreductase RutF
VSKSEQAENRSGGGIVFGGGQTTNRTGHDAADVIGGMRRRWAGGVAIVTAVDADGGYRGVTVSSLMAVSGEPPVIALALTGSSSFHELALPGSILGVSVLDARHEFPAERFAGRAPLPDARFAGIDHRLVEGVPLLQGALAWAVGSVWQRQEIGDHVLVLLAVSEGGLAEDTDDPLLRYEGRYRRLEAG